MTRFTRLSACWIALWSGSCSGVVGSSDAALRASATGPCVAGIQLACSCADHSAGVATCDASGHSLGACMCSAARSGVTPDGPGIGGAMAPVFAPQTPELPGSTPTGLARAVRISQLAFYQPVKIPLMDKGDAVAERIAPVIVGKRALLRVFVETLPGYAAHDLGARLQLLSATAPMQPLTLTSHVEANSSDEELTSTFNFELPEDFITDDLRYAVQLEELAGSAEAAAPGAADPQARWPAAETDFAELGARDPGAFRVVIVPYRYQGDGSGRLPVMSDAEMASYKAFLRQMYPASQIELSVHEPVDYTGKVDPTTGWAEWLDSHCNLRQKEDPDPKVFYYGMIAPRETWQAYGGGIAGISNLPGPAANFGRCSVGIGFAGFAFVAAHELGHALGLEHAPCGTSGGPFPYPNATVGVWGYDLLTAKLVAPDKSHDLMSYCDPPFMSDYNYRRLFDRIRYLNIQFDVRAGAMVDYQRVLINSAGQASLRGTSAFALPPGGPEETRSVALLDPAGQPVGESVAYYFPFSQDRSGVWFIPHTGMSAVRIDGVGDVPLD